MDIFLFGHTGFIGKNIYNYLSSYKEYNLIGVSSETIDLTDVNSPLLLQKILTPGSIIIMCVGVKKQLGDDINIFGKNIIIINNFIKVISKIPVKKIIYFSSASVYGEDVAYTEKINEETPVQLRSYYGIAKYTAESLLKKNCFETKTQLIILRPPLIYGKDDISRGYGPTGFVYKAINNEKIILWGDGKELREFIYIEDIVKIVGALLKIKFQGTLNLVSGKSQTFLEIIEIIQEKVGIKTYIEYKERTKEKVDQQFSNKLLIRILSNFKFTNLEAGIQKLYSSIEKN